MENLFSNFYVKGTALFMLCVLAVAAVGYILGRITIKGVNLGTGGVFIIALVFGVFLYTPLSNALAATVTVGEASTSFTQMLDKFLSVLETLGLVLFVTSVGFIAGPKFFSNLKKNFKSYILLGLIIIVAGALATIGCIYVGRIVEPDKDHAELTAMIVGILSGSLTSTPAFSAAKATVASEFEALVSVGHAIAYLFGVIGVVLFVQLIPKFMKADMAEERAKITAVAAADEKKYTGKLIHMDEFGFMPFALAAVIGVLVGSIKIGTFSLTTTGGCLLTALIFGHFSRIGKISIMPEASTLKVFREFGLMLFLIGAGISGGAEFIAEFQAVYFIYGVIITIVPMVIGFLFAKYVLKLPLLNNLGSITGGMTSTPALGTLIGVSKTEDVASAYAATYPFALIAVVLASQLIIIFFS